MHHSKLIILQAFIYLAGISLSAQGSRELFSKGYNSEVGKIERLEDSTWIFMTRHKEIPGGIYQDTFTIYHVDDHGQLLHTINLQPPNPFESFLMENFLALPGGAFVASYSSGECDAIGYEYYLEKRDTSGELHWLIILPDGIYPYSISVSPDSNILIFSYETVLKLNTEDGRIIWEIPHSANNMSHSLFIPGTEDILLTDETGIKYFRLDTLPSKELSYSLEVFQPLVPQHGYLSPLFTNGTGTYYTYNHYDRQLYQFTLDLEVRNFARLASEVHQLDFQATHDGVYALTSENYNSTKLIFIDTTGKDTILFHYTSSGLRPESIQIFNDGIGVLGTYGSGPAHPFAENSPYSSRAQVWFKFYPQFDFTAHDGPDIAVTDVQQESPIEYQTFWSPGPFEGYLHTFTGGDFKLQVTNFGNIPVHSFWLNITFAENLNVWWCSPFSVKHLYVEETLQPGDSVWIDFGAIDARNQLEIPDQFCFWASGPNHLPDFRPANDMHCMDRIVAVEEAVEVSVDVYPNPVNDQLYIKWPNSNTGQSDWRITDMAGRMVMRGEIHDLESENTIPVTSLSPGIYVFHLGSFTEKIIVNR